MKKKIFFQRVQKTSIESDLQFLMLLKGNSFQNATFFARIHKKLQTKNIFFPNSQRFAFSAPLNLTEMV